MIKLALWGDSIGRAVGFHEGLGRYAVIKPNYREMLEESQTLHIDNHARFGATLPEGLADFEDTADVSAPYVAIQFGGNDCNFNWAAVAENPSLAHSPVTPLNLFEEGLNKFVRLVRQRGKTPILVTPPPLHAQRFFDWVTRGLSSQAVLRYIGDVQHIYRWQERYAATVQRVARLTRSPLFDLRDAFLAADSFPDHLCQDGMHPNEKGQRLMALAIELALPQLSLA